jgi:hypothetical protein
MQSSLDIKEHPVNQPILKQLLEIFGEYARRLDSGFQIHALSKTKEANTCHGLEQGLASREDQRIHKRLAASSGNRLIDADLKIR